MDPTYVSHLGDIVNFNRNVGQHVSKPDVDPVKIWFFIVLGVLVVSTVAFFLLMAGVI